MSAIAQEHFRRYLKTHYGNLIQAGPPEFNEREKTWIAHLKSDYPQFARDDSTPDEVFLRFLKMEDLGKITLNERYEPIEATTRDECVEKLDARLLMWRQRAENIVVQSSANQLSRVRGADYFFMPFEDIIINLFKNKDNPLITDEDIERDYLSKGKTKYIRLLQELKIIRKVKHGYTYGNLFRALEQETKGEYDKFLHSIYAYIIRERYTTLREVFDITRFARYVKIDNCYYKPALDVEKLIKRDERSIINQHYQLYGYISPLRANSILEELIRLDALERKGQYIYGNEELFSNMLDLKDKLPPMEPRSG